MNFESRALFDLTTTEHEPVEPMNKIDLAVMRELYSLERVNSISWSPGQYYFTDALTKDNRVPAALLLRVLREGQHTYHRDKIVRTLEQPLIQPHDDKLPQTGECKSGNHQQVCSSSV